MKRVISFLLSIVMVISMLPVSAFATDVPPEDPTTPTGTVSPSEGGEQTPDESEPAPSESEPAPSESEPAPSESEPAPSESEPAPSESEPAPEEEIRYGTVTVGYTPTEELEDSDVLLDGFMYKLFYGDGMSAYGTAAGKRLSPVPKALYDCLKNGLEGIASGEDAVCSTSFGLDAATLRDWGATVSYTYNGTEADLQTKANGFGQQFNLTAVVNALLHDCPYELFWFNKTVNPPVSMTYGYSYNSTTLTITDVTVSFQVVQDMRADNYDANNPMVNVSKAAKAQTAVANAREIFETYENASAYEKLLGFKNEICDRVTYDYNAVNNGNFSADADPWQLISVFDGDTNTNVVCEGYSKAFQYLCDLANLECYTVTGNMNNDGDEGHMWNVVRLGDKNYLVDVTNSDAGMSGQDGHLFLKGYASGSLEEGYTFTTLAEGGTTTFAYDSYAFATLDEDVLTLSDTDYDPDGGEINIGETEGTCGTNLTWVFDDSTGTLTIRGTGEMANLHQEGYPWADLAESIKKVVFESGITKIGIMAFFDEDGAYSNLQEVSLPDTLLTIGSAAFDSTGLKTVEIPEGVKTLEDEVFVYCENLESVSLPSTLEELGLDVFANCTKLKSITIPGSLEEVHGFRDCTSLETVILQEGVKNIGSEELGYYASPFTNCTALQSIQLPDSLEIISDSAFEECHSLETITIPANVSSIGSEAFTNCTSLTEIRFLGDAPTIKAGAFFNVVADVYYPANNATWTDAVKQHYNGTLTWKTVKQPLTQDKFLEELNAAQGTYELTENLTITDMDLSSKSIKVAEGVTLTVNGTLNLNWSTLTVDGTLNLNGAISVNNDSRLIANGTVNNNGALHVGYYKESDIEGYAGVMEVNGTLNVKGGYMTLRSMQANAGGSMTVNGTLNIQPNDEGRGGFIENAGKIVVSSTGKLNVSIDELNDGGIWVWSGAELTVQNGATKNIDDLSISVVPGENTAVNGLDKSILYGVYQPATSEALKAALTVDDGYGAVRVELNEGSFEINEELNLHDKTVAVAEDVTLTVNKTVNLNWSTLIVDGTLDLNDAIFVNNDSRLIANGTVNNNGALHVGYQKESNIEGYAGVMEVNGTLNVKGGYMTLRSMQANAGGSMTVNGTLNVQPNDEGHGGFIENAGKIVVSSTGKLNVSIDELNDGGIWVWSGAELTVQNGATKNIDDLSISVVSGETTAVNGLDKSILYGIYQPTSPEALEAALTASEGYGAVKVELNEGSIVMNRALTVPKGVTLIVAEGAYLGIVKAAWTVEGTLINNGNVDITGGGKVTIARGSCDNENNGTFHVGMNDGQVGTLDVYGIMDTSGFLCVHPGSTMNIADGTAFTISTTEDGAKGFLQCNGTVNVYGSLDNAALLMVDNTSATPAVLNVAEDASLYNIEDAVATIGENGILTLDGDLFNEAVFAIEGTGTITETGVVWKQGDEDLVVAGSAKVENSGIVKGNVRLSGVAEFTNKGNGTVTGSIIEPDGADKLQKLIDDAAAQNEALYLDQPIKLDRNMIISTRIYMEEGGSIAVPADMELTIEGNGHLGIWEGATLYLSGTMTTKTMGAVQVAGRLIAGENHILNTDEGQIAVRMTSGTFVSGNVDTGKMILRADISDAKTMKEAVDAGKDYYSLEMQCSDTVTLDQNITVPANAMLQLSTTMDSDDQVVSAGELTIASGYTLTNNGNIIVDEGCSLINNGTLVNTGVINVKGNYIKNGTQDNTGTIMEPIKDAATLIAALENAGKVATSDNNVFLEVTAPIELKSGDIVTVPAHVYLYLYEDMTVPAGAKLIIRQGGFLGVSHEDAKLSIAVADSLENRGTIQVEAGWFDQKDGTYNSYPASQFILYPDTMVTGIGWKLMTYKDYFTSEEELREIIQEAMPDKYGSYWALLDLGKVNEVTVSEELTVPGNTVLDVSYGTTLRLESDSINYGTINVYDEAVLEIAEGATLTNSGRIFTYGTGAFEGDYEGNEPGTDNSVNGIEVYTYDELVEALKEANKIVAENPDAWPYIKLLGDVTVPAGATLTVPKQVTLGMMGDLTVPARARLVIDAQGSVEISHFDAVLKIESGATLINNNYILIAAGEMDLRCAMGGTGYLVLFDGVEFGGFPNNKIVYVVNAGSMEELKTALTKYSYAGYNEVDIELASGVEITENITIPEGTFLKVGDYGGDCFITPGTVLTVDGGLLTTHESTLKIARGATLNINGYAEVVPFTELNNYGTLNVADGEGMHVYGTVNNYGYLNGSKNVHLEEFNTINENDELIPSVGVLNNYGELDGALGKLEAALQTGNTYTLTQPLNIIDDAELRFAQGKVINITGEGALNIAKGVEVTLAQVEVVVSSGGAVNVGDGATLNMADSGYMEVQDGSITAGQNATINVDAENGGMLVICEIEGCTATGIDGFRSQLTGLYVIESQNDLMAALNKIKTAGYGDYVFVINNSFALDASVDLPANLSFILKDNHVLTVAKDTTLAFNGLVNIIHGGHLKVLGYVELCADEDSGPHFPAGYVNVASNGKITVNKGAELNLHHDTTLNLGINGVLENYGTVNNYGSKVVENDGSTVVGNRMVYHGTMGIPYASDVDELIELCMDPDIHEIEIAGNLVINRNVTLTNEFGEKRIYVSPISSLTVADGAVVDANCHMEIRGNVTVKSGSHVTLNGEINALDGAVLTVEDGATMTNVAYLGIHGAEFIVKKGAHVILDGNTDIGSFMLIEDGASVYNCGKFFYWGTVENRGTFETDRPIKEHTLENDVGEIVTGEWIGNAPVVTEAPTMTQEEFRNALAAAGEEGLTLYKTVVLTENMEIDKPVCLEFPGAIIVAPENCVAVLAPIEVVGGRIEIQNGGELRNYSQLNVRDGDLVVKQGATLVTPEIDDWDWMIWIEVNGGGYLTVEEGGKVTDLYGEEWDTPQRAIRFYPQQGSHIDVPSNDYLVAYFNIHDVSDLEWAIEYAENMEVRAYIQEPIVLNENMKFPGHLELNVYELTDEEGNLIPGLTVDQNVTLDNEGRILIHEFAQVRLNQGSSVNNSNTVVLMGGELIDNGASWSGNEPENDGSTHAEKVTDAAQLEAWLNSGVRDEQIEIIGDIVLDRDITVHENQRLFIGNGASLTVPENFTLYNYCDIIIRGGTLIVNGMLENYGYISVEKHGTFHPADHSYYSEGVLVQAEGGKIINVDDFAITDRRYVTNEHELRDATYYDEEHLAGVEICADNNITLTDNFYLPSGVHMNMNAGTLKVASNKTLTICGSLHIQGDATLHVEAGAKIEILGELQVFGKYILEGREIIGSDATRNYEVGVYDEYQLADALKNADVLDTIYLHNEITVDEEDGIFEIPADLDLVVHGELIIPETVNLEVNGRLLINGGLVDMKGDHITNNGRISVYFGGRLHVVSGVETAGNGKWTLEQDGFINTGELDHLINFMSGGDTPEELAELLAIAAERSFKSASIVATCSMEISRELVIPANTILSVINGSYVEVTGWNTVYNYGVIEVDEGSTLLLGENVDYIDTPPATYSDVGELTGFLGEIRLLSDDSRFFLMKAGILPQIFNIDYYEDGSYDKYEQNYVDVYNERELRAALSSGYDYTYIRGHVELEKDLVLPRADDSENPQAQKVIVDCYWIEGEEYPSSLTVAENATLTINSRLNIQSGSTVTVHGALVNNVYEDDDPDTDDIGIWCEDGELNVYGTYENKNGGVIIMTTNYGFMCNLNAEYIRTNTYVYSENEMREALNYSQEYNSAQICVYEDIILKDSLVIPGNVNVFFDGASLMVPAGKSLTNYGIIEIAGNVYDTNKEVKLIVAQNAKLYNYGNLQIADEGVHATMLVDAGGKFYNYGEFEVQCDCDRVKNHVVNNTVLVKTVTASVNGNATNPTISVGTPVQLAAAVAPANATQKDVMWTIVSKPADLPDDILDKETGMLTVEDLPDGMDSAAIVVRASALDGSEVYDDLEILAREFKVDVAFDAHNYDCDAEDNPILRFNQKITMRATEKSDAAAAWALKSGHEQYATLAVNRLTGVATLTAKTLTEKQTVEIIASAANGVAEAKTLKVVILPKVQMVSIENADGQNITGQTVNFDIGKFEDGAVMQLALKAVVNPSEAATEILWTSSAATIATVDENGLVTFTGKTGTVKLTATAQDGSRANGVVSIKVVDLIQEVVLAENTAKEVVGGKNITIVAYDAKDTTKKLTGSQIKWSLDEKDTPFASIAATTGVLTTKKVSEKVTVTVRCEIIGNEKVEIEPHYVTIYPLTTQVEINVDGNKVNDQTIMLDYVTGKAYMGGRCISAMSGPVLAMDAVLFPSDVMPGNNIKWTSSSTAIAKIDESGLLMGVQNTNGTYKTGTVTVTAAAQDGSNKKATVKVQIGSFAQSVAITPFVLKEGALRTNEYVTLTAKTVPEKPTTTGIVWSLADPADSAYVTMASNGRVTAKAVTHERTVVVRATSKDGMAYDEIEIKIRPKADYALNLYNDDMAGQIITNETLVMDVLGGSTTVNMSAMLLDVANMFDEPANVTWKSSNAAIAGFETWDDATGALVTKNAAEGEYVTVKLLKSGTATITATGKTTAGATLTAKVTVKGTNLVSALEITSKTDSFMVASGKTLNLTATAFPAEANTKTVTWSLLPGGEQFATISTSGALKAKDNLTEPAVVTVVATAKDGSGVTAEVDVQIMPIVQGVDIWMENEGVITGTTLTWDMAENSVLRVFADTYPELASQNVTWKSSSASIAEIDAESGMIICKKAGTATITATANDGSGKNATFKLTVVKRMTGLSLTDQVIAGGKTLNLGQLVQILESDTTNKKLTWTLSGDGSETDGTAFVTLSATGSLSTKAVTGIKKVTVTVASTDGSELVAQCEITITPVATNVNIYHEDELVNNKTLTLGVGDCIELTAVNTPEDALQDWTWSSNNTAVEVDENGRILVVSAGKTATITAKANDGSGKSSRVTIKTIQRMEELTMPVTAIVASTKSITLKPEIAPANTTTKTLNWSIISGNDFATIDKNGKVTAKKLDPDAEPVTITVMAASTDGSNLTSITKVMIMPLTTKVNIVDINGMVVDSKSVLYVGEEPMYLAGISDPAGAAQTYTWSVSNANYAGFVTDEGVVSKASGNAVLLTGLVPGKAVTVTATAEDGSGKRASFSIKTAQRMQDLILPETAVLGEGKSMTLRANVLPANTTNKNLTWNLIGENDHEYATLSAKGVLTAERKITENGPVTVTVEVSSNDGSDLHKICQVTIHPLAAAVQIYDRGGEITQTISLPVGESFELDAKSFVLVNENYEESEYLADSYTWQTSHSSYVAFAEDVESEDVYTKMTAGNVTVKALKPGATVTITATANDGSGKRDTIRIKTVQPVTDITLEDQVVNPGRSIALKAVVEPANATNKKLKWSIAEGFEEFATIYQNGVLVAKAGVEGVQEIPVRVEAVDGYGEYEECVVSIRPRTTAVTVWTEGEDITGKTLNLYMNTENEDKEREFIAFSKPTDAHTEYTWQVSNGTHAGFVVCNFNEETGEDEFSVTNKTVAESVILRALQPGKTVTVTATANDGSGKRASFRVKTMQSVEYMELSRDFVLGGRTTVVGFDVYPKNASNTKVDWEISSVHDDEGTFMNEEDVLIRLGNVIYAKPTDRTIYVNIHATAQDGAAEGFMIITILPEKIRNITVFERYEGEEYPLEEDMLWMYPGSVVELFALSENFEMSLQRYDWSLEKNSCIKFVRYDDEIEDFVDVDGNTVSSEFDVMIMAVGEGNAKLTVKAVDGSNETKTIMICSRGAE